MTLTTNKKIRIFLAEDHPIFRNGLAQVLKNEPDFEVCGEAEDAYQAKKMIFELMPDFIIVDISLKDSSGIDLIKEVKAKYPKLFILTLSMHDELIYAERVLRAGAKGYVMKQEAPETIVKAIRHILKGNIYMSTNVSTRIFNKIADGYSADEISPVNLLSDRELEIFQLIGRGFSTRDIASKLVLSIKTVENHKSHIKEKLNLKSAIELVQHATLWVQNEESK